MNGNATDDAGIGVDDAGTGTDDATAGVDGAATGVRPAPPPDSGEGWTPSRRTVLKTTAGLAGLPGLASGRTTAAPADADVSLEARRVGDPLAPYANEAGLVEADGGLVAAIADWRQGVLATDRLLQLLDHWRRGTPVETAGDRDGSGREGSGDDAAAVAWVRAADAGDDPSTTNPTLTLSGDAECVVGVTNRLDGRHRFVVADDGGSVLVESDPIPPGSTRTVSFTPTPEMATYYSSTHPSAMRGPLVVEGAGQPGWLTVPAGGSVAIRADGTARHAGVSLGSAATLALQPNATLTLTG